MHQTEQPKKPFFAKFLEAQKTEEAQCSITKPWLDLEQTQKYPSDGDEV